MFGNANHLLSGPALISLAENKNGCGAFNKTPSFGVNFIGVEEDMTSMAMGLDRKLQREYGADYIGTEEYFRTIDAVMRKRFPEHFDDGSYEEETTSKTVSKPDVEEAPRRATRPANVVAPAARSTPPGRIRLKQSEVATARRLGVPIEEYARQVALLRNGD